MKNLLISLTIALSTLASVAQAGSCRIYLYSENGRACDRGSSLGSDNYYAMNLYLPATATRPQALYVARGNPNATPRPQLFYFEHPVVNDPKACLAMAKSYFRSCFPISGGSIVGERAIAMFLDGGRATIRSIHTVSGGQSVQVRNGDNWVDLAPYTTIFPN